MKYAILADIHGNKEALDMVIEHAKKQKADRYIVAGDIINYGADSKYCVQVIKQLSDGGLAIVVAGNHEFSFQEGSPLRTQKITKLIALTSMSNKQLKGNPELIDWIRTLPVGGITESLEGIGAVHIVHGFPHLQTPKACVEEYFVVPRMESTHPWRDIPHMYDLVREAEGYTIHAFRNLPQIGIVGHTHTACVIEEGNGDATFPFHYMDGVNNKIFELPTHKVVINPGSVGQPRDGNPMAAYMTLEGRVLRVHRVEYDIASAQAKILEFHNRKDGGECWQADRLALGS